MVRRRAPCVSGNEDFSIVGGGGGSNVGILAILNGEFAAGGGPAGLADGGPAKAPPAKSSACGGCDEGAACSGDGPCSSLKLTLVRKWFALIAAGQKTIEYRVDSPRLRSSLLKRHEIVEFTNAGYHSGGRGPAPWMRAELRGYHEVAELPPDVVGSVRSVNGGRFLGKFQSNSFRLARA